MEGFYWKKGRARELLTEEKTGLFLEQDKLEGREQQEVLCVFFFNADDLSFLWSVGVVGEHRATGQINDRLPHWY